MMIDEEITALAADWRSRYEALQRMLARAQHENRIRDECLIIAMETLRQYALGRNNAASRSARAKILGRLAELEGNDQNVA